MFNFIYFQYIQNFYKLLNNYLVTPLHIYFFYIFKKIEFIHI
jgi:hypothetical protein